MTATAIAMRKLPRYTRGEEIFNMVTHIVGGGMGVVALVLCVITAALRGNTAGVWTGAVFGTSMIILYTMSSIYHGLRGGIAKRVMQVMDHCTIYLLIAGTYTPVLICSVRTISPLACWINFGVVWALAALGVTLTAIDLKKYRVFSMICYLGMGWSIIFAASIVRAALSGAGFALLLAGGIAYTVGAVFYGIGRKKKYCHGVFHLFILLGSLLHILCILFYVM